MNAFLSITGHLKSCKNLGGPSPKAKHYLLTDSEQVPRGKGEKNPDKGNEKTLKPYIYKQSKLRNNLRIIRATAYLLYHEPASCVYVALG